MRAYPDREAREGNGMHREHASCVSQREENFPRDEFHEYRAVLASSLVNFTSSLGFYAVPLLYTQEIAGCFFPTLIVDQ